MQLALASKEFEQLFFLLYGMNKLGIQDQELRSIFQKLNADAKIYYGESYYHVCQALNDDFKILNPN
ncbi:hypothetical protein ACM55F_10120 [Flavobacterium sp. XS2P12]|uniref:hypothetical protein n=1 Tax=Flavobacterium melibiosi TaxID=3398734 RepID=UPI003A8B7B0D